MLKYEGVLIAVKDIAASRRFYEEQLGQAVKFDFGVDVAFEGGLTIHQKDHFQGMLGGGEPFAAVTKSHAGELYFETDAIELFEQRLKAADVVFIHPICEQPWAQRVMRFYDPDGHVVEIGERMDAVVMRLSQHGASVADVCQKTGMPREFVEGTLEAAR